MTQYTYQLQSPTFARTSCLTGTPIFGTSKQELAFVRGGRRERNRNDEESSETRGFKGEGDGKETGSEKNEEKEGGGGGKVKEEG